MINNDRIGLNSDTLHLYFCSNQRKTLVHIFLCLLKYAKHKQCFVNDIYKIFINLRIFLKIFFEIVQF